MTFDDFNLHPDVLDGIAALNYTTPTPIQQQAIPLILEGKDLIGVAQTGTGKTAAFVLPIIDLILESGEEHFTQALVIVPTRELAVQIDQVVEAYSYFTGVSSIAIYGGGDGKSFNQEKTAITSGVDIIVATPGRLIAHMQMGYVDFKRLRFLVLDEADRMLDMGFLPDLNKIVDATNPARQSLLFSATMPPKVNQLARQLLRDPATVSIALSKPAAGVDQKVCIVPDEQKVALISHVLRDRIGQRIIVFCSTKQAVSKLYQKLKSRNFNVGVISSDLEQEQREQVMLAFRNRQIDILVATDVVSRGIDVEGIDMVINYDVPRDAEDYVHRVGRTGRAERKGEALTLVSPPDMPRLKRIEKLIGKPVDRMEIPAALRGKESAGENGGGRTNGESGGGGDKRGRRRGGRGRGEGRDGKPEQRPRSEGGSNNNGEPRAPRAPRPEPNGEAVTAGAEKTKRRRRRGGRRNGDAPKAD